MNRVAVALVCCAVGCGQLGDYVKPTPVAATLNRSGERLHVRWGVYGDVKQYLGFHDTERGEDCDVTASPDGRKYYCGPPGALDEYFADASCTQHAARGICGREKILIDRKGETFRPVVGTVDRAYMLDGAGACKPAGAEHGTSFVVGGEPQSMSAFVAFTPSQVDARHRLQPGVFNGADGSRVATNVFYDTVLWTNCYFMRAADGVERCMPWSYTNEAYWDEKCTTRVVGAQVGAGFYLERTASCGYAVWEVTGRKVEAPCSVLQDGVCKPVSATCSVRALTPRLPEDFATAPTATVTSDRLQQTFRSIGNTHVNAGIFDVERKERCWLSDRGRCVPEAGVPPVLAGDSSCTPTFTTHNEYDRCEELVYRSIAVGCETPVLRRVSEPVATPAKLFTLNNAGACIEGEGAAMTAGAPLFTLGPPIADTAFAKHDVVIDN